MSAYEQRDALIEQFASLQMAFESTVDLMQDAQDCYRREPTAAHLAACLLLAKELAEICTAADYYAKSQLIYIRELFQRLSGGCLNALAEC